MVLFLSLVLLCYICNSIYEQYMNTDFSLKEMMKKDHEAAFKIFFKEYYPTLCLYCKRFIADKGTREDIVQDVFISLWSKWDEISFDEPILFFLKTCAKNNCLDYLSHQRYEQKYIEENLRKAPSYDKEGDCAYIYKELNELLKSSLKKLPESYRQVYVMSYINGKTNIEIAELLGVSTKTIERYKSKSIECLKKDFKDYLPFIILYIMLTSYWESTK